MMPFGAGNRKCPGDHFTMVEATLMLATVASRWRLMPVAATDLTTRIGITLRPRRIYMRTEPGATPADRPALPPAGRHHHTPTGVSRRSPGPLRLAASSTLVKVISPVGMPRTRQRRDMQWTSRDQSRSTRP
jgi:hypothetical protein